jgi:5,10-methylenetetrahydromethanopterin reductase
MPAGEAVRLARRVEDSGVGSVWLSEDLFFRGAVPTAGAVAGATSAVAIGFGVLTPFNRHPSLIAMDAASLCELAPGRIILGLGAGVKARVDRTSVVYRKPLDAMRESVEIIRGLLAGETVTLDGEVHSANRLSLDIDVAEVPPIYLASTGPRSLKQTGEIGDGLAMSIMSSLEHIRWATSTASRAAKDAGRPDLPSVVYMPFASSSDATALTRLKSTVGFYIRRWASIPTLAELFTGWGPLKQDELDSIAAELESGRPPEDVVTDQLVREYCVAGTPDECLHRLEELAEAGVTEVALDIGKTGRGADQFADEIDFLLRQTT